MTFFGLRKPILLLSQAVAGSKDMQGSHFDFDILKSGLAKQAQHIGVLRSLSLVPDTKNNMIICRVEPDDKRQQGQFADLFKG